VGQASDKHCRLTQQGIRKLEDALGESFGDRPSDNKVAESFSIDRGTVGKIRNAKEGVNRSSIDRLFTALNLDLLETDYETIAPPQKQHRSKVYPPNPFEEAILWGREELLRQIFEQLEKGGSQAFILRAIVKQGEECLGCSVFQLDMHLVRDERSFFDRLCDEFGLEASDSLSRVPWQIERELKRRKQPQVLCLDEIHVLTNETFFPEATRNWLKGMADAEYPLQLVVASQKELDALFPESPLRSSPLADFFRSQTVRLDYWSVVQVTEFVGDRLQGSEITFEANQLREIWEKSGGKPKEVRVLAGQVYEAIVARKI
jgi:hypothetical protein